MGREIVEGAREPRRRDRARPVRRVFLTAGILWGLWSGQTDWLYYPTEAACNAALRAVTDEGVLWVIDCKPMTDAELRMEAERQWPDPTQMRAIVNGPRRR
jgi:hypothetical protein